MSENSKLNPQAGNFVPKNLGTQKWNPNASEFKPPQQSITQPAQSKITPQYNPPQQQYNQQQQQHNPPQKPPRLQQQQQVPPYVANPGAPPRNQFYQIPYQPMMPQKQVIQPPATQSNLKVLFQNKQISEFVPKAAGEIKTNQQKSEEETNKVEKEQEQPLNQKESNQQTEQLQNQQNVKQSQSTQQMNQSISKEHIDQNKSQQQINQSQVIQQNQNQAKSAQVSEQTSTEVQQKPSKETEENSQKEEDYSVKNQLLQAQDGLSEEQKVQEFLKNFQIEGLIRYKIEFMINFENIKKPVSFSQEYYHEYDIQYKEDTSNQINQTNWNSKKNKKKQGKRKQKQDDINIPVRTLDQS